MDHTGAGLGWAGLGWAGLGWLGWLGWAGVATSVRIKVMQDTGDQRTPAPHLHTVLQLQSWEHLSHSLLVFASEWLYAIRPFGLISDDPGLHIS